VDIFGCSTAGVVAAQAKNMNYLAESEAIKEIAKAEKFSPNLTEYYFAIAGPRDAKFQTFLRNISRERSKNNLFSVHAIFFDDVVFELSSNENLIKKYWGHFFSELAAALGATAKGPLLDEVSALDEIRILDQFKSMTEYFNTVSDPDMRLSLVVEHAPDLRASATCIDRYWRIAIGESRPENTVFSQRIAVSVDGKEVRIWQVADNSWLTIEEWNTSAISDDAAGT
jgi:hypothetical protein